MATSIDTSQFTTALLFSNDNPCNCTIELGGKILYVIETRRENKSNSARGELIITTEIYDGEQEHLLTLTWRDLVSDIVTWKSRGMDKAKLSGWLKKSRIPFNHASSFKDYSGSSYNWDIKGPRNQSRLLSGDKVIAYFERAQPYVNPIPGYNYNPVPTPSRLRLSEEADAIRELVVFSFIFMEKDRRQSNSLTERYADQQAWMGVASA